MITRKIGHQGCSLHRCAPAAPSFDAFVWLLEGGAVTLFGRFAMVWCVLCGGGLSGFLCSRMNVAWPRLQASRVGTIAVWLGGRCRARWLGTHLLFVLKTMPIFRIAATIL